MHNKYTKLVKSDDKIKLVNPHLGQYVPVHPKKTLELFDELAGLVPKELKPKETLVIGFAEKATAIGLHYAIKNHTYYIQTTREKLENGISLDNFQSLDRLSLDRIIPTINRIIFVDDEIVTGKTVLSTIDVLENVYGRVFTYDVVSVLNRMNDEVIKRLEDKDVNLLYLQKVGNPHRKHASSVDEDGMYCMTVDDKPYKGPMFLWDKRLPDLRTVVDAYDYVCKLKNMFPKLKASIAYEGKKTGNMLILGSEEFMYPSILFAEYLSATTCYNVKVSATTRSEITTGQNAVVHEQYQITSLYGDRAAYVYDVNEQLYDLVVVLAEYDYLNRTGLNSLLNCAVLSKERTRHHVIAV